MSRYKPDSSRQWRGLSYKTGKRVRDMRAALVTTKVDAGPKLDSMCELLLTILALSVEGYDGPLSHAVPKRLAYALRKARKAGLVHVSNTHIDVVWLEELGCAYLDDAGFGGAPFTYKPE